MKFVLAILISIICEAAKADYLECKNTKEQPTQINFFNHWNKITFQLSAPYLDRYLYILGQCYSENEIGLPYSCDHATTEGSEFVDVKLVRDEQGQPVAAVTTSFVDGTSNRELVPCLHFDR